MRERRLAWLMVVGLLLASCWLGGSIALGGGGQDVPTPTATVWPTASATPTCTTVAAQMSLLASAVTVRRGRDAHADGATEQCGLPDAR